MQWFTYDLAGNVTNDSVNDYKYDMEGRLCAVYNPTAATMPQYVYDADGMRVAKGTISTWSCDTTVNGFTPQSAYVMGPHGEQLTEMTYQSGSWQWLHTNVSASGLSATYDADLSGKTEGALYFHLSDWLGTRRQQTDYAGNPVLNFTGLPFGDGLTTIPVSSTDAADATEHHFTGKERDAESENDYFGARYYSSSMGRWMSPDPVVVSPALDDPQSWNKYSYTFNKPLSLTDPDGRWPGWYHTELDRNFFGNQLHWNMHDQQVIVQESALQDSFGILSGRNGQSTENVRWHGMDDFWHQVGPEQAIANTESYISQSLNQAVYWQLRADYEGADCSSCHDAALQSLADAEHAAQDLSSPEHRGKPWTMWGGAKHWYDERHSAMSSDPSDEEARAEAIYLTQVTYSRYQQQLAAAKKKQKGPPSWGCLVNGSCR